MKTEKGRYSGRWGRNKILKTSQNKLFVLALQKLKEKIFNDVET